jgi:biopolymer transport protein ExbD
MAFRPSQRRQHRKAASTDLNLNPLLDVMTVLIPLLLANAQFAKIGVIDLDLPPAAGASGVAGAAAMPKETARTLDLTVSITERGFYISSALAVLKGADGGPIIPRGPNEAYDFDQLSQQLYEVKQKAGNLFADKESIIIQADKSIRYQILVDTMDAARSRRVDGKTVVLFPNVALSAGVF